MRKYFYLQLKRAFKFFPFILTVTVILFIGLSLILFGIVNANSEKMENKTFNIGVSGDFENKFLQFGINAFKTIDETRFSLDFLEMDEKEAKKALTNGDISAYVVLPHRFVEDALKGNVKPITFVTTTESNDIATMFKSEITTLITDMVVASQKGTYGIGDALSDNGHKKIANKHVNAISIKYFDLVLSRNKMLSVEELGISSNLSTVEYYICSIIILFIMIMGLPFVFVYCSKDDSLSMLLISKGYSCFTQQLSKFLSHLLSLITLTGIILMLIFAFLSFGSIDFLPAISFKTILSIMSFTLPIIFMLSAFNIFIFELCSNLISGLLMHFLLTLSLCYISGCFFPLHSFPKIIQSISFVLPVCVAREQLATYFTNDSALIKSIYVIIYAVFFFFAALFVKHLKMSFYKGGRSNA